MVIALRGCSCDLMCQDGEFAEGLILNFGMDAEAF